MRHWRNTRLQGTEPEFLNFEGVQESTPINQFHQPVSPGGPIRQPYSYSVPSPHRLLKKFRTEPEFVNVNRMPIECFISKRHYSNVTDRKGLGAQESIQEIDSWAGGLGYRHARLAESIPWNRLLGPLKLLKFGLCLGGGGGRRN